MDKVDEFLGGKGGTVAWWEDVSANGGEEGRTEV